MSYRLVIHKIAIIVWRTFPGSPASKKRETETERRARNRLTRGDTNYGAMFLLIFIVEKVKIILKKYNRIQQ